MGFHSGSRGRVKVEAQLPDSSKSPNPTGLPMILTSPKVMIKKCSGAVTRDTDVNLKTPNTQTETKRHKKKNENQTGDRQKFATVPKGRPSTLLFMYSPCDSFPCVTPRAPNFNVDEVWVWRLRTFVREMPAETKPHTS